MSLQQRLKRKNPLSITSLNMLSKQGGAIGNRGMRTPMLLPSYVSKSPGLPSVPKPTPVKDSILAPVAKESVTPPVISGLGGNYGGYDSPSGRSPSLSSDSWDGGLPMGSEGVTSDLASMGLPGRDYSDVGEGPGIGMGPDAFSGAVTAAGKSALGKGAETVGLGLVLNAPGADIAGAALDAGKEGVISGATNFGVDNALDAIGFTNEGAANVASKAGSLIGGKLGGVPGSALGRAAGRALGHIGMDLTDSRDQEGWHDYGEDKSYEGKSLLGKGWNLFSGKAMRDGNDWGNPAKEAATINQDIESLPGIQHDNEFNAFKGNIQENDFSMFDTEGSAARDSLGIGNKGDVGLMGLGDIGQGYGGDAGSGWEGLSSTETAGFATGAGMEAGGGGDTVLCTELHRQGYLPDDIYKADSEYGRQIDSEVIEGYHLWARPLAKLMKKNRVVTAIVKPFVKGWAYHMAYKMGVADKPNRLGSVLEKVGIPICRFLGTLPITISCKLKPYNYGI